MTNDVLINKVSMIERCLRRIDEEYRGHENELETNFTRQDSIILNLQRACEASIDAAMHLVRVKNLGIPQESRDAFEMVCEAGMIDKELKERRLHYPSYCRADGTGGGLLHRRQDGLQFYDFQA